MFIFWAFVAKGDQVDAAERASNKSDAEETDSKLKHQSVLQSKLTRLAIQIGYAGLYYSNIWLITNMYLLSYIITHIFLICENDNM